MDHLTKRFYTREEVVRLSAAMLIRIGDFSIFMLILTAQKMYNTNVGVIRQRILDTCLPLLYKTFSITSPHYITAHQSEGLNTATNCNSTQSGVKLCNYNNNHNIDTE